MEAETVVVVRRSGFELVYRRVGACWLVVHVLDGTIECLSEPAPCKPELFEPLEHLHDVLNPMFG